MVYCTKCGADNEESAQNCKSCGAPLNPQPGRAYRRRYDEDMCFGRSYMWSIFIGVFLLLLGLSALLGDVYAWARFDKLWPLPVIFIALVIIYNAVTRRG